MLSCDSEAQPPWPCEQPGHSVAEQGHGLGCALLSVAAGLMLWVWALLPSYTCCLALPLCFVHGNMCLFAEYREKEEEKKENERWWWRLMWNRKTLALGQLLWSSIYQHNFFSLLVKTNFLVLQEGKEMGLIAVFSLEQDILVSLIIRRITGFFCLKAHNRSSFHKQSPLIRNKNIFMDILCLCLLTCLLVFLAIMKTISKMYCFKWLISSKVLNCKCSVAVYSLKIPKVVISLNFP